ncbi:Hypothetical predicted protein [Olea europaea subsp. europaea]|uniref:FAR1 domain-containing protein n=1 Tax=Olea europaea subsp. europaea TaxID=158383 RepID=A0A8S0TCN0_OLEEU|nr:Hypothetical predicted protein [Olea europaea subsp. europaea]
MCSSRNWKASPVQLKETHIGGDSRNMSNYTADKVPCDGVELISDFMGDDSLDGKMLVVEDEIIVLEVGMKFADDIEVFEFYKKYAYQVGFPVRKRNMKRGDDGMVRYVSFTCSREGQRSHNSQTSLNPTQTIETGCKARLTTCSDTRGIFRINVVHLEHNHKTSLV